MKIIEGNRGKRKLPDNEPEYDLTFSVPPPELSDPAKVEWRRIYKELKDSGVLTDVDRGVLTQACDAWGHWIEFKLIEKHRAVEDGKEHTGFRGKFVVNSAGNIVQAPWIVAQRQWWDTYRKACSELGITPASRTRVTGSVDCKKAKKRSSSEKYGF